MERNDTRVITPETQTSEVAGSEESANSSRATQILLSPAPIRTLYDEFSHLVPLGKHFGFIGVTIFTFLEEDRNAESLRAALRDFNKDGDAMVSEINDGFSSARSFYAHNHEEFSGKDIPTAITDGHTRTLLDPVFQKKSMRHAQTAATAWGHAAQILRTQLIPALPGIQQQLDDFVEDYSRRSYLTDQRKQSWLPYFVQDSLWGSIEPVRWNTHEVEALPQDCVDGGKLLIKLLGFLGRMQAHFLRISQLQFSDPASMGILTPESLRELYLDRVTCGTMLRSMDEKNAPIEKAFWHGIP
ncbi:hypothetical protein FRC17_003765 [Serendipita sp. 399]|nr:hypothetical protein FRC17_003765 [Serendipita sp. 399]